MNKTLLSIVLCLGAAAASAQPTTPQAQTQMHRPGTQGQAQIVQTALVLPAGAQSMRSSSPTAAAQLADTHDAGSSHGSQAEEEGKRPATLMLLSALALMVGIALRRWSLGQQ